MKLFGKISYVFLLLLVIGCSGSDPPKDSSTKSLNQEDRSEDKSIGSSKQNIPKHFFIFYALTFHFDFLYVIVRHS